MIVLKGKFLCGEPHGFIKNLSLVMVAVFWAGQQEYEKVPVFLLELMSNLINTHKVKVFYGLEKVRTD